jgi:hypothetical protein
VGTLLFSAISMSAVVVALHGATRVPDDLFLDEAEVGELSELSELSPTED